uniref:Hedgehog acyltransferase n=1 Tax=Aotus nancymaae TaxID=37293 RepID=A0A2K5DCZ2_AOTNA
MLPRWELALYLLASLGFHFYSFYEVYKVSREHEKELDQEFELETDTLFGGLKKDATDFEWSFWMEWGKQWLVWLLLGHMVVSQIATLLARKRRWYKTENEYYLLHFTLTVRCLYYTSFSLELCWRRPPAAWTSCSFPWTLAYVFYYPVFHNGPVLSFPEFIAQMQQQERDSLKASLCVLALGLGRLLFWWWLAELMAHLMYMHAFYSSIPLLGTVSCWTLGNRGSHQQWALAQVLFFLRESTGAFGVTSSAHAPGWTHSAALPRCSFTGEYFDVGLHNFLIRYVYIPVGGSRRGLLGTLFSTAMTFAFVSYWHGGYDYLWCWAALNWLGVTVENGVRRLVETPCIRDSLVSRILAPVLRDSWPWVTLSVLGFLYCYSHVGIAWAQTYAMD